MKLAVLTLFSAAAIAATAWSEDDPDADDTGKNTPDRDDQSQTATDNNPADIKISADIRKKVVDDGGVIGGTLRLLAGIGTLAIPGLGHLSLQVPLWLP